MERSLGQRRVVFLPEGDGGPFVGRDDDVEELAEALGEGAPVVVVDPRGGIGRGRVAREVARRLLSGLNLVWWLDARREATLAAGLVPLAEALGIGTAGRTWAEVRGDVLAHLNTRRGWLLVLDGAPAAAWVSAWTGLGGRVLLSSAAEAWPAPTFAWSLQPLGRGACETFLSRRTDLPRDEVRELASRAAGHPLSLELMAAALGFEPPHVIEAALDAEPGPPEAREEEPGPSPIVDTGTGLEAWLAGLIAQMQAEAQSERHVPEASALFALVSLATRRAEALAPGAEGWLTRLACLGGGPLPEGLLAGPTGALAVGRRVGLLGPGAGAPLHPASAACLLRRAPVVARRGHLHDAAEALGAALADGSDPRPLVGPALALLETAAAAEAASPAIGAVGEAVATLLLRQGLPTEARRVCEVTLSLSRHVEPRPAWALPLHEALATTFEALGEVDEAQYQLEEALVLLETHFGADDPRIEALNQRRVGLVLDLKRRIDAGRTHGHTPHGV